MSKKISALLMAFSLVLGCISIGYAGEIPADLTEYKEDFEILFVTDILSGDKYGNYPLETTLTRKEICYTTARLLGLNPNIQFKQVFSDVNKETEHASDIYSLYNLGIISGKGNGNFAPDDFVSGEEAITIFTRALGYKDVAVANGGFPYGYITTAQKIGMLETDFPTGKYITKLDFAKLVRNVIDIELYDIKSMSDNGSYVSERGDDTLLSRYLGIKKITGTVDANEYARLGTTSAGAGSVSVDGVLLKPGETDIGSRLGYLCDVYYDSITNRIICYNVSEGSEVTVISSNQEPYYKDGKIYYFKDETESRICNEEVYSGTDIIYNNKKITSFSGDLFDIDEGEIAVIDSDNDNKTDTIIITEYKNLVVNFMNLNTMALYLKNESFPYIDLSEIDFKFFDANGRRIDESYVKEWGVLSAVISDDLSVAEFYLCEDKIKAEIREISESENKVMLNGKYYEFTKSFTDCFKMPKLGDEKVFLINKNGYIAGVKQYSSEDTNVGYFVASKYEQMKDTVSLKILTDVASEDDNNFLVCEIDGKVRLDGKSVSPSELHAVLNLQKDSGTAMVVLFTLDENGKLLTLNTLHHNPDEDTGDEIYESFVPETNYTWRSGGRTFDGVATLKEDAKVLYVPSNGGSDSSYGVATINQLDNDKTYDVNYKTYKIGLDSIDDSVIIFDESPLISAGSYSTYMNVSVVTGFTNVWDSEEMTEKKSVKISTGGKNETVFVKSDDVANGLGKGDVIKVSYDINGKLNAYKMLFDFSEEKVGNQVENEMYNTSSFHGVERSLCGYVYRIKDGMMLITKYTPEELEQKRSQFEAEENYDEAKVEKRMVQLCEKHQLPNQLYVWDSDVKEDNLRKVNAKEIYSFSQFGREASKVYLYSVYSVDEFLLKVR